MGLVMELTAEHTSVCEYMAGMTRAALRGVEDWYTELEVDLAFYFCCENSWADKMPCLDTCLVMAY